MAGFNLGKGYSTPSTSLCMSMTDGAHFNQTRFFISNHLKQCKEEKTLSTYGDTKTIHSMMKKKTFVTLNLLENS